MATHIGRVESSLDDRLDILNGYATALQVFGLVGGIQALVKDKLMGDHNAVHLAECCFNVCVVLSTAIQGKNLDHLEKFEDKMTKEGLEKVMHEIEQTLKTGAYTPNEGYTKKVENHLLEIQQLLDILVALSSPHDGNDENAPPNATTVSGSESACGRLINRNFAPHDLPSLIETIFSNRRDKSTRVNQLPGNDAQTFIDVIYEALDGPGLFSPTREKCLRLLYKTCGHYALLPKALDVPNSYDRTTNPMYKGGYADVWKGEHRGRDVAVKVMRMYSTSDLQKVVGEFCKEVVTWKFLRHPNVLPLIGISMSESHFAMISNWMADGNICDYVRAHPDTVDRRGLLTDVSKGLIYIHSNGMVHGDLKGANILVDETGHARIADFGFLTIISDPTNFISSTSSTVQGGTVRWMSPELIDPQHFNLTKCRPTTSSDCYALGMVIYEIIAEKQPFHEDTDITASFKIMRGDHPPRGSEFTDRLWGMLESCWESKQNNRPSVEEVLRFLEMDPNPLEAPTELRGETADDDGGPSDNSLPIQFVTDLPFRLNELDWNTPHAPITHMTFSPPTYQFFNPYAAGSLLPSENIASTPPFYPLTISNETDGVGFPPDFWLYYGTPNLLAADTCSSPKPIWGVDSFGRPASLLEEDDEGVTVLTNQSSGHDPDLLFPPGFTQVFDGQPYPFPAEPISGRGNRDSPEFSTGNKRPLESVSKHDEGDNFKRQRQSDQPDQWVVGDLLRDWS